MVKLPILYDFELAGVGPNSENIGNVRILENSLDHFDEHQKSSLHTNFECVGGYLMQNLHENHFKTSERDKYP